MADKATAQEFDVLVLGGGSAGYAAALRSVQYGKSVALVEKSKVGGTCLHWGCIPTKAYLHAAEVADEGVEDALTLLLGAAVRHVLDGHRLDHPAGVVAEQQAEAADRPLAVAHDEVDDVGGQHRVLQRPGGPALRQVVEAHAGSMAGSARSPAEFSTAPTRRTRRRAGAP